MRIENGIVYFDKLAEQAGIAGLFVAVAAIVLTITFTTILGAVWWLSGWNMHTSFWAILRVGLSLAIYAAATSFVGMVWTMPTIPR